MSISTRARAVRTALANRRTEWNEHRRLSEELAAFQTPAERNELDEVLSRYSYEETRLIRAILDRHDHERAWRSSAPGGQRL